MKTLVTSVRLKPQTLDRLNNLAKLTARTKNYYINQAVEDKLDDLEDLYYGEKTLREIHEGKQKTVPAGELYKELGLED